MIRNVTLDLGSLGLDQAALRTVYGGIVRLSSNEPDLLTGIAFNGRRLTLFGVSDSGETVIGKLGDYLGNLPLERRLASLLTLKLVGKNEEEGCQAPVQQVA